MSLRIIIVASNDGAPVPGLDLTDFKVSIYSIHKTTEAVATVVNNADMGFAVGSTGMYGYFMPNPDYSTYAYATIVHYTGVETLDYSYWQGDEFGGEIDALTSLQTQMARALGLMQENMAIDQTSYDGDNNLTSSRVRLYSNRASVGSDNDVLATYTMTAAFSAAGILTSYTMVINE